MQRDGRAGGHRRRRGELSESAGDKADAWQKVNNQYFVIGWRCEKKGASPTDNNDVSLLARKLNGRG